MYLAVLIGFEYGPDTQFHLASTRSDLEVMTSVSRLGGGSVVVLSDGVGSGMGDHHVKITSTQDFDATLEDLELDQEHRLLIYYTGHGEKESSIRLPNGDLYPLISFRNKIIQLTSNDNVEIVFIIDCCYSGGLSLPWILDTERGRFKLSSYNLDDACVPLILCLSSSNDKQRAAATEDIGSLFTRYLSQGLCKDRNLNLITLCDNIRGKLSYEGLGKYQTMSIHCSYPLEATLWTWILNPKLNIRINNYTSTIIVSS
jgi:hypothetical protein